jgi:hypothetical protein
LGLYCTYKALKNPNYNFRTVKNIAKETGVGIIITESLLFTMEKFGIVRKVESKNRTTLWGLTKGGEIFAKQQGYINSLPQNAGGIKRINKNRNMAFTFFLET